MWKEEDLVVVFMILVLIIDATAADYILDIHNYLMKKNNMI